MADWPSYKTARDLAGTVFPVSENVIHQQRVGIHGKNAALRIGSPLRDSATLSDSLKPVEGIVLNKQPSR
jgi:hypothetical protein